MVRMRCREGGEVTPAALALSDLFSFTGGSANWKNSSGWRGEANIHCCNRFGVVCNAGLTRVTELRLGGAGLIGSLPPSLLTLTELVLLDVQNNTLMGRLPANLQLLSKLQVLNLGRNRFSGPFPLELFQLPSIRKIEVASNMLTANVTGFVFPSGSNLERLDLFYNRFVGVLDESFGQLTNLRFLNIGVNLFSGQIPRSVTQLTNLKYINLSLNEWTGTVPRLGDVMRAEPASLSLNDR